MSDFDHTPPSRFEQIMRAIIDGTEVPTGEPRSVMEALLLELNDLVKSIRGGIRVIGVTSTPLTDGSSTNPITINGESYTAENGDMVAYSAKEFLFNGSIWQELGDVYEVMAIIDNILANMAPNFSSSVSYNIGAYVIQNNHFYKCTTAHSGAWAAADFTQVSIASELIALKNNISAKQDATDNDLETTDKTVVGAINELKDDISTGLAAIKNGSIIGSFADVEEALESKTDNDDVVASAFSAEETYAAGEYCTYNGGLYKFKAAHTGAWSAADVNRIKIAGELSELKNAITNVGNMRMTKLWENPDATQAMLADTEINVNTAGYDFVMAIFIYTTEYPQYKNSVIVPRSSNVSMFQPSNDASSFVIRNLNRISDTKYTSAQAYKNVTAMDKAAIPTTIYGIKLV